ncbi:hypothetical protein [Vreelandella profundi]|uniref:hypothetical protein n=1 Tax=Vreelandella profundi TaxID=2852117 RepID=UPI001F18FE14|nr:hypothetical protein [Halomonas profundi]
MITLNLTPQRGDRTVSYSSNGQSLVITVDGEVDEFDFSQSPDGIFSDFVSDTLAFNPLLSVEKNSDGIVASAIMPYGAEPARHVEETNEEFNARYAEWSERRLNREVTI